MTYLKPFNGQIDNIKGVVWCDGPVETWDMIRLVGVNPVTGYFGNPDDPSFKLMVLLRANTPFACDVNSDIVTDGILWGTSVDYDEPEVNQLLNLDNPNNGKTMLDYGAPEEGQRVAENYNLSEADRLVLLPFVEEYLKFLGRSLSS